MKVEHSPDRRTTIEYGDGIVVTWTQPYNQSFLPSAIKQMIQDSAKGDQLATAQRMYMRWNYKLTVK